MTDSFIKADDLLFSLPHWESLLPGLKAGITSKQSGFSKGAYQSLNMGLHVSDDKDDVLKNRQKTAERIGFPLHTWVCSEQTHGSNIQWVTENHGGSGTLNYSDSIRDTDGLITNVPNLLLTMCYADCVPIYFLYPEGRLIGAAHAGWKGTVLNIAGKMIEEFKRAGADPADIQVAIGPSICRKCYQVDDRVIDKVEKLLEDCDEKPYNLKYEGQYELDLKKANELVLQNNGVPSENISISQICTVCEQEEFFSHRRDNGKTGRIMSFIGWKE
ncbi:peptidoglycan editing factor PgeF [Rossellomorea vietnamensis]|uniref:Purine nucleoside phosphorylase n=1 Tax=Rossellomorea aquimaris TaxID=189382 RepID=A0A5D4TN88_9BACI|nr:peptidoglycan editing factor PgeF [Rossellomorea aquimaris]TYS77167.1 peptidoglycan editing factor PgeF [Rossellomorea aquimaris]